uniref:Centrosomal protein 19 n=1 Tax=Ovis aries TaxID=9940 RepID=A0AC11DWU7_SHEEP
MFRDSGRPSSSTFVAPPLALTVGGGARSGASAVTCTGAVGLGRAPWTPSLTLNPARCPGNRLAELPAFSSTSRFQPPAIILIYENEMKGKNRQRIMPVRNFSKYSDCSRAAEQLKNNPRHKGYLEQVSLKQLEKLFSFLRGNLWGQSLAETMEQIQRETTIDPEEDLNKLDDKELAKRKSIMDELFEKNQKKKDDPDFVYDIEVEFPQDEQLQSCGWDTESAEDF